VVEQFAAAYAAADLLLRLPFAPDMEVFPRRVDVGLLAAPGRARREELAAWSGARPDAVWALPAFTSLALASGALDRIAAESPDHEFFTLAPLDWRRRNIHTLDPARIAFSDLLASVDVVLSKPGYGLVSDCVANRKPLIHAVRENFAESEILVRDIRRYLRQTAISADDLYAGRWRSALDAIARAPSPPERLPGDGARQAADRILS